MDFSVDEQVNEHQLILFLRLTEEVLAFVESAHSPHLDWATIAHQLAPHRQPPLTPRECRALWRKLAYRNSNTARENSSSRQFAGAQHESEERTHGGSDGHHLPEHHQETRVDREEDGGQGKGARGKKKRKNKEGSAGKRRREALEAQPSGATAGGEDDGSAGEGAGTAEKRPRTSSTTGDPERDTIDASLSGVKPVAATDSTSTTPTPTAVPRANGGNPLGTPLPDSSADTAAGGAEAHGKGPRKRTMWTNEEDILLLRGVQRNGEGNWAAILRDQAEGSLLLRRNSTQLAQRWNAIKRKIQRAHYAGLDEATKNLAIELVSQQRPPQAAPLAGTTSAPEEGPDSTVEDLHTEERRPPTEEAQVPAGGEQPFRQTLPGPSRVFD